MPIYWGNDERTKAYQAFLDEERRREMVRSNPNAVLEGKISFKEASRFSPDRLPSNVFAKSGMKGSSYDWESKYFHDMPKTWGKSYDEKFNNITKAMGVPERERRAFRAYLDQQEKGTHMDNMYNDMLKRNAPYQSAVGEDKDDAPIVPAKRSGLDRTFDALSMFNYMSGNISNNLINEKDGIKGVWEGIKEGAKAGNPFGDGYEKGETTYSDVMNNAGWKPKGLAGKMARGTAGFALDVLLDPTTYLTLGTGALAKGAGVGAIKGAQLAPQLAKTMGIAGKVEDAKTLATKVYEGAIASGKSVDEANQLVKETHGMFKGTMSDDIAKKIVRDQAERVGETMTDDVVESQAKLLKDKYHELIGTNRENVGIGIGIRESIANPIIRAVGMNSRIANKIAGFHVELPGSAKALETVSKYTGADKVYSKIRNAMYGSMIGKMFSTKHGLIKIAQQDPERVYDFVEFAQKSRGFHSDKKLERRAIEEYAQKNLVGLEPSDVAKLMDALQDKTMFTKIARVTGINKMREVVAVRKQMARQQQAVGAQISTLTATRNQMEQLRQANELDLDDNKAILDEFERNYYDQVASLDLSQIKDEKKLQEAIELKRTTAEELERKYQSLNYPDKPEEVKFEDAPKKPKRESVPRPAKPEYEVKPEKPDYPDAPKKEDFLGDENSTLLMQEGGHGLVKEWEALKNQVVEVDGVKSKGKTRKGANDYELGQMADKLSVFIYGEKGKISRSIYPGAIDNITKMISTVNNRDMIKHYIEYNKAQYDGRAKEIYEFVARKIGYGRENNSFKSWEAFYTERIRELKNTYEDFEKMSPEHWKVYKYLEDIRLERIQLVSELMMIPSKRQLMRRISELEDTSLLRDVSKIESSFTFAGSEKTARDAKGKVKGFNKDGTAYTNNDAGKILGEDDAHREMRDEFSDDDSALGGVIGKNSDGMKDESTRIIPSNLPKGMTEKHVKWEEVEVDSKYQANKDIGWAEKRKTTVRKGYFIDPKTGEKIEYQPERIVTAKESDKDFRKGEYERTEFDFTQEDIDEIRGIVLNEIMAGKTVKSKSVIETEDSTVYRTDVNYSKGTGHYYEQGKKLFTNIKPNHIDYADRVAVEMYEVLRQLFPNKSWKDLSPAHRRFAIGMAKKGEFEKRKGNEFVYNSMTDKEKQVGAQINKENVSKDVQLNDVHKRMAEQLEVRKATQHVEAVRALIQIGGRARFNKGDTLMSGNVVRVYQIPISGDDAVKTTDTTLANGKKGERTDYSDVGEYETVYEIRTPDGTIHEDIRAIDISHVQGRKPLQVLTEDSFQKEAERAYNDAVKRYEDTKKQIDEEHRIASEGVDMKNEEKKLAYQDAVRQAQQKRAENKAQYDADMEQYKSAFDKFLGGSGYTYDDIAPKKIPKKDDVPQDDPYRNLSEEEYANLSDEERMLIETGGHDDEIDYFIKKYNKKSDVGRAELVVNNANREQWEEAIRNTSKIADSFLEEQKLAMEELKKLLDEQVSKSTVYKDTREALDLDFDQFKSDMIDKISKLEINGELLDESLQKFILKSDVDIEKFDKLIKELEDGINNDDAMLTYLEANMPGVFKKWDEKYNGADVGKMLLDSRTDMSDNLKKIAHELRTSFNKIGADEVEVGRLTQGQYDAWVDEYLTHLVTDDGKRFFEEWRLTTDADGNTIKVPREQKEKFPAITQDLGYDEVYNPYSMERQIKKLKMPDGTWVERPTIAQINEVMKPFLKGKNAFSENISDIYVARMLKHSEVMYDEKYMVDMMRRFGEDLDDTFEPKPDFKVVMNYGLFQRNVKQMANLNIQLERAKLIDQFLLQTGNRGDVDKFVEQNLGAQWYHETLKTFMDKGYGMLGLNRDTINSLGKPLLDVNPEQARNMTAYFDETMRSLKEKYEPYILRAGGRYPDAQAREMVAKYQEILDGISPMEIKQIHSTITDKANMARELQIAKDRSKMLGVYDKFTHLMKLNQTTVLPSFHTRNALSNMFQVWLAVGNDMLDIKMHKQVKDALHTSGNLDGLKHMEAVVDKFGNTHEWTDLFREAESRGIFDTNMFATELGGNDASEGLIKGLHNISIKDKKISLDPTDTKNFIGYRMGSKFGSSIENQARFFQFVSHIKNGMDVEKAHNMVNKHLFDYSDLTHFERNVMKRIMPYYTWIRKNARLQMTQLFENPGKYRDTAKVINMMESGVDEEDRTESQYLAPFARDWIQLPFNSVDDEGNKKPILLNPNMPFMDLTRMPNLLDPKDTFNTLVPQMNVLPKALIEQGFNKNIYFDSRIVNDEDKGTMAEVGKRADNLASAFAPYVVARDMFKKEGGDKDRHFLNTTAGIKTLAYDYKMNKDIAIQKYLGKYKDKNEPLLLDKMLDKVDGEKFIQGVQGDLTRMTDDFVGGAELTKESTGALYPFAKIMKEVGLDSAQNRQWVASYLESTDLDKALLKSDFTSGKVTKVRDGDTIEVEVKGKTIPVRMNMIDTPETDHGFGEMAYASEAKDYAKRMLDGKDVRLVISKNTDAHGRYIAYVYADGVNVSKELLEQGYAKTRYVNSSDNPYRIDEYRQAQQRAVEGQSGIWGIEGYAEQDDNDFKKKKASYKKYLAQTGRGE